MDKITLPTALSTDVWKFVAAAEPNRLVRVEMTYDELLEIVQRILSDRLEAGNG